MSEATAADWSRQEERGSAFWVRTGFRVLNLIGYPAAAVLLVAVMAYFFATGRRSRRASLEYLRHLHQYGRATGCADLPRPTLWNSFRHHLAFGFNVLDRMYFWQDRIHRFHFTWEGREHLFQARERGTGVLLVGAHIGSFDAARALSQDKALPLNVVMYRGHAQKLNAVLNARGPGADINVIELDEHDVDTVFDLESRLARGEIVAVLADRVPPFSKPRTSRVPFLGVPADLPQNVWILAGLLKCPVFFSGAVRTGWRRYHVFVAPMTDRVALPRKQRDEALTGMIEAFAGRMERLCFQYPFQWFNFFSYWSQSK